MLSLEIIKTGSYSAKSLESLARNFIPATANDYPRDNLNKAHASYIQIATKSEECLNPFPLVFL